ncbi:heme biosynthesis protein HemY [Neisseriaceae bacterium TC5R-5]|nr:heme biosynthesis protein HemY [Neisseriaceae bacterium TC5R-5]
MKFTLWITALFALAVLLALLAKLNTGYAILFLPPYRLEISFNLLIVSMLVLVIGLHYLLRMLTLARNLPKEVRRFQREKKLKTARHALREAGIAYFEGRFQKAEREASKSLKGEESIENQALALLIAARSAAAAGDIEKRDEYLNRLDTLPPRLQLARHMLDAELKLEAKDAPGALDAIERARALSPSLTNAMRLELKVRLLQKQPDAVLALSEKLLKADALEPEQARRYRLAAYQQQLVTLLSGKEVQDWLRKVPDTERHNPQLVDQIVSRLQVLGDYDYAATLIAQALANDEHDTPELSQELSRLAEHLSADKRLELLKTAENWLKKRPQDHWLLMAIGRLAIQQQLWGKAQSYLEASLSIKPTLCAHAELAKLFEATGKEEQAQQHYHKSLEMALAQHC